MRNPSVRLLSEPGESWVVEFDRNEQELLLNPDALGLARVSEPETRTRIADVGAALVAFLGVHPAASDEELTVVATSTLAHSQPN